MWFRSEKHEEKPTKTGARGEAIAVRHLRDKGYKIIARNVRPDGHEELDIICETRDARVFVEVKTRTLDPKGSLRYGTPATAVTREKRRHLFNAARIYNSDHPTDKMIRMDIIEVYLPHDKGEPYLHHMEDAFRS